MGRYLNEYHRVRAILYSRIDNVLIFPLFYRQETSSYPGYQFISGGRETFDKNIDGIFREGEDGLLEIIQEGTLTREAREEAGDNVMTRIKKIVPVKFEGDKHNEVELINNNVVSGSFYNVMTYLVELSLPFKIQICKEHSKYNLFSEDQVFEKLRQKEEGFSWNPVVDRRLFELEKARWDVKNIDIKAFEEALKILKAQ